MEDVVKRVQAAYDYIADRYASVNRDMPQDLVDLAHELTIRVGPTDRIVDLGCGLGRDMAWFESHGMNVVGIDLSYNMLVQASYRVSGKLCQMDIRQLAFHNEQFQAVWCCAALLHLPKSEVMEALKEIHRVLSPKGFLVLSIQEGEGESWEGGYCRGVKRFFARYHISEMTRFLLESGFAIQLARPCKAGNCVWLAFMCIVL